MTDNPNRSERLAELWEAYILPPSPSSLSEDRPTAALAVIEMCRRSFEEAQAKGDRTGALYWLGHGRAVWTLLAIEVAAWLTDTPGFEFESEEKWSGLEQVALISQLQWFDSALPPPHRSAVDPVPILLPRWLYTLLLNALHALKKGEIHPIVAATAAGGHDDPWTWDEMRARALEYVAFLRGQGMTLQRARTRVGLAMKVAPETLRAWESECRRSVPFLDTRLETAREAGRYKVRVDEDPNYTKGDGNSVDAHVLALFNQFSVEPLSAFGKKYRARFGKRHHTPEGGGD